MRRRHVDSPHAPAPEGGYAQAVELSVFERLLFVSGQVPVSPDGTVSADFAGQARQAFDNLDAQLRSAGWSRDDIVKLTVYLADRADGAEASEARRAYLGPLTPALTVVVAGIYDEAWRIEVEAVAAR